MSEQVVQVSQGDMSSSAELLTATSLQCLGQWPCGRGIAARPQGAAAAGLSGGGCAERRQCCYGQTVLRLWQAVPLASCTRANPVLLLHTN